jgi:opacity protein-like surface antigen
MKRFAMATGITLVMGLPVIPTLSLADSFAPEPRKFSVIIELAGADESDRATQKELQDSGTQMVPASPSAESRDPLQPAKTEPKESPSPIVVEEKTPQPVPTEIEKEAPAEEIKSAVDSVAPKTPAAAAQSTEPKTEQPDKKTSSPNTVDLMFKPYARIHTGFSLTGSPSGDGRNGTHQDIDVQDTGLFGVGVGMKVDDQVRVEGNVTYYSPFDVDGQDGAGNTISTELESIGAMVSVLYDIEQVHSYLGTDTFTPYVGAGVGISMLDTDTMTTAGGNPEPGTEVYNLTYAARAGLGARISDTLTLDFGYKFMNMGKFEQDGGVSNGANSKTTKFDDLLVHEFTAGLRFQF